jgi:hypothetical protein
MFWLLVALAAALPRMPLGAGAILLMPSRPSTRPVAAPGLAAGGPS